MEIPFEFKKLKPSKCPLCSSTVNFHYLNLDELTLMCENFYCDFPLGYEKWQILKTEEYNQYVEQSIPVASIANGAAGSGVGNFKTKLITDEKLFEKKIKIKQLKKQNAKQRKIKKAMEENLARIAALNAELNELKKEDEINTDSDADPNQDSCVEKTQINVAVNGVNITVTTDQAN